MGLEFALLVPANVRRLLPLLPDLSVSLSQDGSMMKGGSVIILEASRRASKSAAERLRRVLMDYDRVVFRDVFPPAEQAIKVVRDKGTYVLTIDDPSVGAP